MREELATTPTNICARAGDNNGRCLTSPLTQPQSLCMQYNREECGRMQSLHICTLGLSLLDIHEFECSVSMTHTRTDILLSFLYTWRF